MIPDWVQLMVALVGLAFAWYLFREQQRTDFNRLERKIAQGHGESAKALGEISKLLKVSEQIDLARDLSAMREAVESLRDDLRHLTQRVLEDVRQRQGQLMEAVQKEFVGRVEESQSAVGEAVAREIMAIVAPEAQDRTRERLQDLYLHAMRSVGLYQRSSIEAAFKRNIEELEATLRSEVSEVAGQVEELGRRFDELPALPPATASDG